MKLRFLPLLILTTSLFAQGPGRGPRHMMMVAHTDQAQSYLNLTDAQIQSLKQIQQAEMTAVKPIMQQIAPLRDSLRTQMQSGSGDATAVGKLILNIQTLEQQIKTTRDTYRTQALAVLTADQRAKLAALQSAADLMPTVHQAMALNLLTLPAGAVGPGGMGFGPPE